jgi:hypothetical protein
VSEKNDRVEQLQADIEAGVADLVEGEDWQRWLRVASRFPRYSFRNTLLIQLQCPDASVVMGYRAWEALGHQVRKGSKSISILAPCTYKTGRNDKDAEDQDDAEPVTKGTTRRVLRGFRIAHVFDPLSRVLSRGQVHGGRGLDARSISNGGQGHGLSRCSGVGRRR